MATRQEMLCAINLIRHTARVNKQINGLIKVLDNTIILIDDEEIPLSFVNKKIAIENDRVFLKELTDRIKTVITKTDLAFLNNGIADVSFKVTKVNNYYKRSDINLDIDNVNAGCKWAILPIQNAMKDKDFEAIAANFKGINLKTGIVEPDPWKLFSPEINYANILHDILDALSYEFQGLNSYTGQKHELTKVQQDKLFNNRIFTANIYLNKLPENQDKEKLGSILAYVNSEFPKTKNAVQLAKIGRYIDSNLSKLIIVRRWWAL